MKIHWNWGTKITIAIILFMSMIFGFVYVATQNPIILVEKDYYPKGIRYQKRIDQIKNAAPYNDLLKFKQENGQLYLKIPETSPDSGNVTFYRPNEEKVLDIVYPFPKNKPIEVVFPKKHFKAGFYILKIIWWENGKGFYIEKKIYLT